MKIRRNLLLFKLNSFFADLWPLSALAIVYFEQITNSYVLAFGIFSASNITQSILEVPTGIISDKMGRKLTLCTSAFLFILCFICFAYAGNINSILLLTIGGILWGMAEAFNSGTEEALIYETMEELRKKDKYDIVYSGVKSFSQLGLATGALIAAIITYFASLNMLAWIAVIPAVLQLFISSLLIEPNKKITHNDEKTTYAHFKKALKNIMQNPKLLKLSILKVFNRAIGMSSHRLEGVYFNMLVPMWLVNITRIIKQLCGALSFYLAKYVRKFNFFNILTFSSLGMILIKIAGVLLNSFATPFIMSFINIFYGTEETAQSTLMQKEFSQKQRATMGSIVSLFGSIFQVIIYYITGLVADVFSVYFAIIILIICKSFIAWGYFSMFKKYK